MLIPWSDLLPRYGLRPTAVLHIGGHKGQERDSYIECGITDVMWVDANPELLASLRAHVEPFGQRVVEACVSNVSGQTVTFHVTESDDGSNQGQSSSILDLDFHLVASPDVFVDHDLTMVTTTIDDLMAEHWPDAPDGMILSIDLQGADLMAMQGGVKTLAKCEAVYAEVNCRSLYKDCGQLPEVEAFLNEHGFEFVEIELARCQYPDCRDTPNSGIAVAWGDGLARRVPRPHPWRERHAEWWDAWFANVQDPREAAISKAKARAAERRATTRRRVGR